MLAAVGMGRGIAAARPATETDGAAYPRLTNLPTLYIDTEGGAAITSKTTYILSTLHYVDDTGVTTYDSVSIRGRGNSTWGLAKKPYRIKFSRKQAFLGADRAKAKSWTLLANYADKTLIRNAVASCIGDIAGQPFTPAAAFVDLVLNGEYLGNYQVSDQIDVRKKRVDITEQKTTPTADDDISGGYLLEVDGFASGEPVHFSTHQDVAVTIKSPDDDVIDARQISYITTCVNTFEDALFSDNFADSLLGYRPYVDSLTLASWYLSSELTANPDCFWSTYMYKEKGDDRLYWGPLWDYDIAFNNCNRVGDVSEALMVDKGLGAALAKKWAVRLWQDPWFVQLLRRQWRQMVDDGVEDRVTAYIDSVAALIDASQQLNYDKWAINKRVYNELVLFDTYAEGVSYLKEFVHKHCAYLSDVLAQEADSGDGGDDSTTAAFEPQPDYLYRLQNCGSGLYVDGEAGDVVVLNARNDATPATQQWYFEASDDGAYRIVNNDSGMAVADAAERSGSTYRTGTQLSLATVDVADATQQWTLEAAGSDGGYVVANRQTGLAWNNRGGSTADGTAAISWTNDAQNAEKPTRQWRPLIDGLRVSTSLSASAGPDYRVTYSPADRHLHFRTVDAALLVGGRVTLYTTGGARVADYAAAPDIDLSALAAGVYLVTWQLGSVSGSAKVTKE
jgi:hypothetical protein